MPRLPAESMPIEHCPTADHDGRYGYYLGHGDTSHQPGIGALHLGEEAAQRVEDSPQEEDISPEEPIFVPPSDVEEQAEAEKAPEGLVEEGGVKTGRLRQVSELGETVLLFDRYPPGQGCRVPVEFLVKEVTPPPDRLPQEQPGSREIGPSEKIQPLDPSIKPESEYPSRHSPVDSQPSLSNHQNLERIGAVKSPTPARTLGAGEDVI